MYLSRIDTRGIFCQINLSSVSIWRLELACTGASSGKILGIGIRYVDSGSTAVCMFAGLDIPVSPEDTTLQGVVNRGFEKGSLSKDKERFAEALKILHNSDSMKPRQVDEIIPKALGLVDVYYQALKAITHNGEVSSAYEGWRWALHTNQFNIAWADRGPTPSESITDG